jgi:DNA polymerase
MTMAGPLHPWRDTLSDLGVIGLVPPPATGESRVEIPPVPIVVHAAQEGDQEKNRMAFARPAPAPDDPVAFPSPDRVAGAGSLADLEQAIHGCLACPLGGGRLRLVFGEGSGASGLMFVGEGPGRDEDLTGRPFVGRAGELLDKMLSAIGLERSQVYIANIVKCRPPDNRTPTPPEAQRCLPYLRRQIELLGPKVIVTLGATPLRELLGVSGGITRIRGQWQRLDMLGGIPVMPTFHPAYVLRQYTQEVRRAVWSDLLAARKWLDGASYIPNRP